VLALVDVGELDATALERANLAGRIAALEAVFEPSIPDPFTGNAAGSAP
jgi:hypothetical protein